MSSTGVRSRYHIAINQKGFMLKGAPKQPQYVKQDAVSLLNSFRVQREVNIVDYAANTFAGSGWNFWAQTDWSGGFQTLNFTDDGSFKDGQAVDLVKQYGQITLQPGFTSAAQISGGHSYGTHDINGANLILGTVKSGGAKLLKLTSGNVLSTLSAMVGISAVNSIDRFNNNSIIGLTRTSGTAKTLLKYNGSVLSGFRSANPIVRSVHAIGIRVYTGERVAALSGDILYYATNLSAFTSAYQAGINRNIVKIGDVSGSPYFFVSEGVRIDLFRWDEVAQRAYPIYTWDNLTNFGIKTYLSLMIITGTSNGKSVAYAFNGARITSIFEDQLRDPTYDWSKPFELEGYLQTKGGTWDGTYWFPGIYGKLDATRVYTPFENFNNKAYGYSLSGSKMFLGYRDTAKYAISGFVESSEYGSIIGSVDKLVNSVDLNFKALTTGQTIEMFRSTDRGASFQSIGKASYAQDNAVTKKRLYFPSGFVTKLWEYKAAIVGPGTTTPTLLDLAFQFRPIPDLKKKWTVSIDAGDNIVLLNKQNEQRDGKALVQDLWIEMEKKAVVQYEDLDAFNVSLVSAMTSAATSALVKNTRLIPPRGRIRVKKNSITEEMFYTSADGGIIKGISRGQKNTLAAAYTSGDQMDNFYNVIITDISEQIDGTDNLKTESRAQVVILEA